MVTHRPEGELLQRFFEDFWEGSVKDLFSRGRAFHYWIHDFVANFWVFGFLDGLLDT